MKRANHLILRWVKTLVQRQLELERAAGGEQASIPPLEDGVDAHIACAKVQFALRTTRAQLKCLVETGSSSLQRLSCCICNDRTFGRPWHAMVEGYGLCHKCVPVCKAQKSAELMFDEFGIEFVHYGMCHPPYGSAPLPSAGTLLGVLRNALIDAKLALAGSRSLEKINRALDEGSFLEDLLDWRYDQVRRERELLARKLVELWPESAQHEIETPFSAMEIAAETMVSRIDVETLNAFNDLTCDRPEIVLPGGVVELEGAIADELADVLLVRLEHSNASLTGFGHWVFESQKEGKPPFNFHHYTGADDAIPMFHD